MNFKSRLNYLIAAIVLCTSCLYSCGDAKKTSLKDSESNANNNSDGISDFSELSAIEFSDAMGVGWNLGNSLDAYANRKGDETAWGNPEITEEFISSVKNAGFDTIRIPVTYMNNIGDGPDYKIDENWLNRVYEVVNYALENDMFVIINIHHDGNNDEYGGAWIDITQDDQTEMQNKFESVWEQLSEKFKDCSDKLVFESMNEIHDGSYQKPSGSSGKAYYESINSLNQIFINTVRASGGNNSERFLLVPGYNTNIDYTIEGLSLPNDSADDKLMVSVHFYDPYQFALEENMNITGWGSETENKSANWGNEDYVDSQFEKLKSTYIDNNIPVIMGEYGAVNKNNDADREYYLRYVTASACENGIVPIYWDNGYNGDYGFALFERSSGEILYPNLVSAIVEADD